MFLRYRVIVSSFIIVCLASFLFPVQVFGHSDPVFFSPAPNSKLEESPAEVSIQFQSKIDASLFTLQVINEEQQVISNQPATLDSSQTILTISLPPLSDGTYTVKYSVVAKDGHPQQDSYNFSIITSESSHEVPGFTPSSPISNPHTPESHHGSPVPETDGSSNNIAFIDMLIYLIRGLYYFGLLWITGWIIWKYLLQKEEKMVPVKYQQWGLVAQMFFLLGLLSMILVQIIGITDSGIAIKSEIPLTSVFGSIWIVVLAISLLGVFVLFKSKGIDMLWLLSILILSGLEGHSTDFEPVIIFVILDAVHLAVASIWCSGLIFIMLFWKKQRLHVYDFLPLYSKYALFSFILLLVTGSLLSIISLPDIHSLFNTQWGWMLLCKLILVIFIGIVGGTIRKKMKTSVNDQLKLLLIFDFILMLLIIGVVSVLTYI